MRDPFCCLDRWTNRRAGRSAADRVHQPLRLDEAGGVDLVPFPLAGDALAERPGRARRRSAPPRSRARMSVSSRANRQLRSLPSAVRRTRLQLTQNGRLTEAIRPTRPPPSSVVVVQGRGPRVLVRGRGERADPRGQEVEDLGGEEDLAALPVVAGVERHVLDEPQLQAVLAGEPGRAGRRRPRSSPLIATALTLTGSNPAALAARIPSITCSKPVRRVSSLEPRRVQRVEADVDPPQAGVPEGLGHRGEQDAVGRQADVADARDRRELRDQRAAGRGGPAARRR